MFYTHTHMYVYGDGEREREAGRGTGWFMNIKNILMFYLCLGFFAHYVMQLYCTKI